MLYPFAGGHAIQNAAFAIEWPQSLSDADIEAVVLLHPQLKASLPNPPMRNNAVTIQMTGHAPVVAAQGVGAVVFSRTAQSGAGAPSRLLEVSRNKCVGQINEYTRWNSVWREVYGWFEKVVPIVLRTAGVLQIGLQYNDVFHWRGNPATLDFSEVFKSETPYLPKNIFDLKELWHSHHGYFVQGEQPVRHRLLENINVSLTEELGQRSIVITTLHRAELATQIHDSNELLAVMKDLVPLLHLRNKALLEGLLHKKVADQIKLTGSGDAK